MKEHKEFDKYIKGLFDKDPKVPSELSWEEMDFDLPNKPEESKETGKKYIGLFLTLLFAVLLIYHCNKGAEESKIQAANFQTTSLEGEKQSKVSSKETRKTKESNQVVEQENQNDLVLKEQLSDSRTSKITDLSPTKRPSQKLSDEISNRNYFNDFERSKTSVKSEVSSTISLPNPTTTSSNLSNSNSEERIENKSEKLETSQSTINKSNQVDLIKLFSISSRLLAYQRALPILSDKSIEQIPSSFKINNDTESKFKIKEVLVGFGYNSFNLKKDDINLLNDKIEGVISQSFNAGVRLSLGAKWNTNLLLKYDRYHSTFNHSRDLETVVDLDRLVKIYREEITFHNNYTNTLGLQLGLERRWNIKDFLDIYTGVGITPTFMTSITGKTITNTLVDDLDFADDTGRFSVNGALSFGVRYSLSQTVDLGVGYQFNKAFFNEIYINKGIHSSSQNSLIFTLSYRLK